MAGAFNGIYDYIVINAIGFELPDTVPGLDRSEERRVGKEC
jgi:hypothetical protein